MNYYNEIDPYAAAWLRELIKNGHIAPGEVDERSIADVQPTDLDGFSQCHFFAGIGGWSYALRLAGWRNEPVWTGSCPCQPLSSAGKRKGHADERHLWPAFYRLISECKPSAVFGEQVASTDGREWLAGIRADLEGIGYACGGADLCAAGVNAPFVGQRLHWVASSSRDGWEQGSGIQRKESRAGNDDGGAPGARGAWSDYSTIIKRRIKPGIEPVVDGVPGRVGLLRGYGNAIVPQLAAEFIKAYLEARCLA
jgi:DNA (cytosine-5)-methyltransferase 1